MPVPNEWTLEGKVALITADTRGWAPVLAGALAEAGADVAVAGSSAEHVESTAAAVRAQGRKAATIVGEFSGYTETDAAVNQAVSELGGLDILVNASLLELGKPTLDTTEFEWSTVMDANAGATFRWSRSAGRVMTEQGSGHIVNIISEMAERGLTNHVPFSASQAAIQQMTRSLSLEWGTAGVRINCIATGWVELNPPPLEEQQKELLVRYLPLRRKGTPEELATLLIYLSGDFSDFTTGQTIYVDGGAMAHA
ncbi:MAG: SDR family oxidoreductase [Chloroflexi bacterium]|jgi:2-dehydro-3-deoxy-D-gluconate 5-dehydrogenase|nr:SDR family oxidoreductase [Chloroflexota bacterium]MBT4073680.1 SDR family oxidoreductase [Chloroflexota bacterium]MBT4515417.1 SDR family oxidoreductase [Chloroflexota bacterium]MBT6682522.1 SDR family oxidoreductase [Chloroflexota bacterium]